MKSQKKIKKDNLFINIGLMLFTICFLFILLEIFLSFFNLSPKIKYDYLISFDESALYTDTDNPLFPKRLIPNASIMLAGSNVTINSLGFRDYEYLFIKPNNTYRIVVVGDSFTFGYGVELNETYPKQLEKMLNSNINKKIEVLNLGTNGVNTLIESEYIREYVYKLQPDLILLGFFPNDADGDKLNEDIYNLYCLENAESFAKSQPSSKAYDFIKERFDTIILNTKYNTLDEVGHYFIEIYQEDYPGFICLKEGIKRIAKFSEEKDLPVIALIIPVNSVAIIYDGIYNKVEELFNQSYLETYNLADSFGERLGSLDLVTKIGQPHYNYYGNRLIAEGIYKMLVEKNIIVGNRNEQNKE